MAFFTMARPSSRDDQLDARHSGELAFVDERPRDWAPAEWQRLIRQVQADPGERRHLPGRLFAGYLDAGQPEQALRVANFVDGWSDVRAARELPVFSGTRLLKAHIQATTQNGPSASRSNMRDISRRSPVRRASLFKATEAAIELRLGLPESAAEKARLAWRSAHRPSWSTGVSVVEGDLVEAVHASVTNLALVTALIGVRQVAVQRGIAY